MYLQYTWEKLKGYRWMVVIAIILSVIQSSIVVVNPYLAKVLVDDGIKGGHTELVLPLVLGMIGIIVVKGLLYCVMIYLLEYSSQKFVINIRKTVFSNLQHQELSFFAKIRMGEIISRCTKDIEFLRHFVAWGSYQIVTNVVMAIASIVMLFLVSIPLTIALLIIIPFIMATTYLYNRWVRPLYVRNRETYAQMNAGANENINANRVVKAFCREEYEIVKFKKLSQAFYDSNIKAALANLKIAPLMSFFSQSITVVAIALGGYLAITDPSFTIGTITLFVSVGATLSGCIQMIPTLINTYHQFSVSSQKVIELQEAAPLIVDRHDAISLPEGERLKGKIEFRDVSYYFDERKVILDHISFTIQAGQTIAIMGPTGSGKTSLINLIARFMDVKGGSILLDDVDVRFRTLHDIHSSIGIATQDVFLFSDTIDGNIAFSDVNMPEEKVLEYSKLADAHHFIKYMEDGYETIIGERGVGISGGQKQRLSLARALAYEPPILILDDTTSAVDMDTEKAIQTSLKHLPFPCTKIITAQRISSVRHADQIMILEKGHLSIGTHEELAATNHYYREICELQDVANLPPFIGEVEK